MRVVKVPMLDTGLGIEAGYASDEDMIAAVQAERAAIEQEETAFVLRVLEGR